jgi:PAS domain S-box-containing protein
MATDDLSPERSLAESTTLEELRRRERELADFIENASVGLHWAGADGTILWANQAELDLLGYAREEYIGSKITGFHADRDVIGDILRRLMNRETLHNYEARLRCKDGSVRHVLISSNVMWEGEKFVRTRCFTRDITERKRAEEKLRESGRQLEELLKREQSARAEAEQANRLKDEFLATVSHELRTPLTAILGWAHMLRVKRFDAQSTASALETIERNARAQSQLIDDLLDVSRIITGNLRLDVRQVEPGSFIKGRGNFGR